MVSIGSTYGLAESSRMEVDVKRIVAASTIALFAVFGCAAADDTGISTGADDPTAERGDDQMSEQPSMEVIARGSYGALAQQIEGRRRAPFIEVARNPEELKSLWDQFIGEGEMPQTDLSGSMMVFLLMPAQPTGGYGIEPHGVSVNEGTIEVNATLHQPGQTDIVTQAFTAPYAVVEIEGTGTGLEKVVWINEGRPLATKMLE